MKARYNIRLDAISAKRSVWTPLCGLLFRTFSILVNILQEKRLMIEITVFFWAYSYFLTLNKKYVYFLAPVRLSFVT